MKKFELRTLHYVCNRTRVVNDLIKKGFHPIKEEPSRKDPKRKVWIFLNEKGLEEAINEIINTERSSR